MRGRVLLVVAGEVVIGDSRELVDLGVIAVDPQLLGDRLLRLFEVLQGLVVLIYLAVCLLLVR